jgi:Xaa-Pro aminopeptidase
MNPSNIPPRQDLENKWSKLRKAMQRHDAEACLIAANVHLYYLTGTIFDGYFYLAVDDEPLCFIRKESPVRNDMRHIVIRKPEEIPSLLKSLGRKPPKQLMLEGDQITYNQYIRLQQAFNTSVTPNATTLLRCLRMIKTPWEIDQLRTSAATQARVQAIVPQCFHPDMTDIELQANIEQTARINGSIGIFRGFGNNMEIHMGSILAGDNAAMTSPYDFALGGEGIHPAAPGGANGTRLTPGTAVMVDIGGAYTAYISDMTRTYAVGRLPEIAYRAHQISIDIQNAIVRTARPGTACADLYNTALAMAHDAGLGQYFMGTRSQAKFIGHGLGLEINEPPVLTPRSNEALQVNVAFALEPKFVLPGIGAVGIENTFLVTDNGIEKLTLFTENMIDL